MSPHADDRPLLRVVAGVVLNQQGQYLLSSRPQGKAYAGYWEFAGGKVEAGETELAALQRELQEELGITVHRATPWLCKIHAYEHARVHLQFFRVQADDWSGTVQAQEGQTWSWQNAGDFTVAPMLPANGPILAALAIPTRLSGNLNQVFCGENSQGEYRVVAWAQAQLTHQQVLLTQSELARLGRRPDKQSVWAWVQSAAEWRAVQDLDAAVWLVRGAEDVAAVRSVLQQGVSMPLVLACSAGFAPDALADLLALGAHGVLVLNDQTEWV